jgi:hypothetical protein
MMAILIKKSDDTLIKRIQGHVQNATITAKSALKKKKRTTASESDLKA